MFCTKCGVEVDDNVNYCSHCGTATGNAPQPTLEPTRRLMRSRYEGKVAGVCAGVAHYLDVDVTLVRLVWLVVTFMPPSVGLIAYIIAWIVIPEAPQQVTASNDSALKGSDRALPRT